MQAAVRAPRFSLASVAVVALGVFFLFTGVAKLCDVEKLAAYYAKAGNPRWVFFGSGVVELTAGAAMLFPRFQKSAAWALLVMIFLINWAPWKVHALFFLVPQTVTIASLMWIAWRSQRRQSDKPSVGSAYRP